MGSVYGSVLTKLGQIMIKVNVEILILKVIMFNLDSLEKGAFYFIRKCYCVMVFRSFSGTIVENYFGQDLLYVESELLFQLRCMRCCEPPGKGQMHNPGRVH